MKKLPLALAGMVVMVGGSAAWYHLHAAGDPVKLSTGVVTAGDIVMSVACTGTLNAVKAVEVGSQVSGTIAALGADFNSVVRKGQVLAKLDTSSFQAEVDQAKAALEKAKDDLNTAQVAVLDATEKLDRAKALAARQLIPQSDLDDAAVAKRQADADVAAAIGQRDAAQAMVHQAMTNLTHAVILSPIDGIIVARDVDLGQTIAANFQAPALFSIAEDLSHMQVIATVDESDVGKVAVGQQARFAVDAYPGREFTGAVAQVRLQPRVADNVVSYDVVIGADNGELLLRPGMTAQIAIESARRDGVLRVLTECLRFRPTPAVLTATGSAKPKESATARPALSLLPGSVGEVWVISNGRIEPRRVTVGLSDGRYTEVKGLAAGDRTVSNAVLRVAP
jgi:HlyD family secretion protein